MHALYITTENISAGEIIVTDQEKLHHLRDVLRLKVGEKAEAFDESGNKYLCLLREILKSKMIFTIKMKTSLVDNTGIKIAIACAIPKHGKIDDIIDKLTQLGVSRIIPLLTKRVIVKLDRGNSSAKLSRWKKIASSASQQSKRSMVPVIDPVRSMPEALVEAKGFELKLIPTLEGERKPLNEIFAGKKCSSAFVLIGPEGDFTDDEVALAKKSGFIPLTLGSLVLRVDTAAVAVASYLRLAFDFYENC